MYQGSVLMKLKSGISSKIVTGVFSSIILGMASFGSSILFASPAHSQSCGYYPNKNLYRSRTGNLVVGNDTGRDITVTLYHPDTGTAQTTTTVKPGQYISAPNSTTFIADDWGIQISGGCVKYVGNVTHYLVGQNGTPYYQIVISDFSR